MTPSTAFQCSCMSLSASSWNMVRSSGESKARRPGLSSMDLGLGDLSRPFQPVRSLPLNIAVNPAGGVLSGVPEGGMVDGFKPESVGFGAGGLAGLDVAGLSAPNTKGVGAMMKITAQIDRKLRMLTI